MIAAAILLFGLSCRSVAVEVNLTGDWKDSVGWQLTCSWAFPPRDRLQSVRLSRDNAQFKIYRPEIYGSVLREGIRAPDGGLMNLDCFETRTEGRGACYLTIEPRIPPTETTVYSCEVSGERPTFMVMRRDFELEPYVPSNDAHADASIDLNQTSGRVTLNCTASGLPAPQLTWKVDDQKIPSDFTGKTWNVSTKLYHVWSTLSLTPKPGQTIPVQCVPEQRNRKGLVLGPPSEYLLQELRNGAARKFGDDFRIAALLVSSLFYLR